MNFSYQEKAVFATSEKFKAKTFRYPVNVVFNARENVILFFFENQKIIFLSS